MAQVVESQLSNCEVLSSNSITRRKGRKEGRKKRRKEGKRKNYSLFMT
jgi:hypothetical protein